MHFFGATLEDISEGQTCFVAEVWVAHQFLEEGLSDWLSGVGPQPLRSSVPGHHLTVHILSGLPVASRKEKMGIPAVSAVPVGVFLLFNW